MHINEYAEQTESTAVYPGAGTEQGLAYVVLGLCAETGELAEYVKKSIRDKGKGGDLVGKRLDDVRKELGDIMWYWAGVCRELGFNPATVLRENIEKLQRRKKEDKIHGHGNDR